MKNYYVYIHRNKINEKNYVGITCQKPQYRWGKNGIGYKLQPKFYRAIQKYGWDNFDHIIEEEGLSIEQALQLERQLILKYDSINNGYNISTGGGFGYKKTVYCITTNLFFNSVAEASVYAKRSPSGLSHCLHGDQNTCGEIEGIKLEWCSLNEEYNKDAQEKKSQKLLQKQEQREQNKIYVKEYIENKMTITQIGKKYGHSKETISRAIRSEGIEVLSASKKKQIPVAAYDMKGNLVKEFDNLTQALKFIGYTDSNISRLKKACYEPWRIMGGYHWKKIEIEKDNPLES